MSIQEAMEFGDVAIVHGGDGRLEVRVRLKCGKGFGDFDGVLEARPAVEAILARHDELCVSENEVHVEYCCFRRALEARMVRGNARGRSRGSLAMLLMEFVRLQLELGEVGTQWERSSRHRRSFRKRPMSAHGPKEALSHRIEEVGGTRSLSADGKRPTRSREK